MNSCYEYYTIYTKYNNKLFKNMYPTGLKIKII